MPRCRDCGGEANRVLLCARRHDRESLAVVRPTSSRDRGGRATDATGSPRGAGSSPELPAGMVAEEGPSVQGGAGGKSAGAPGAGSLQSREPPAARTSVPREEHGPPASSTSRVDSKRASLKISSCVEGMPALGAGRSGATPGGAACLAQLPAASTLLSSMTSPASTALMSAAALMASRRDAQWPPIKSSSSQCAQRAWRRALKRQARAAPREGPRRWACSLRKRRARVRPLAAAQARPAAGEEDDMAASPRKGGPPAARLA